MRKLALALCVSLSLVSISTNACNHKADIKKAAKRLIKIDNQIRTDQEHLITLDDCLYRIVDFHDVCSRACNTCYSRLRKRCVKVIERIEQFLVNRFNYYKI